MEGPSRLHLHFGLFLGHVKTILPHSVRLWRVARPVIHAIVSVKKRELQERRSQESSGILRLCDSIFDHMPTNSNVSCVTVLSTAISLCSSSLLGPFISLVTLARSVNVSCAAIKLSCSISYRRLTCRTSWLYLSLYEANQLYILLGAIQSRDRASDEREI